MAWLAWLAFIASTIVLVLLSKKNLPLALLVAAVMLGAFTVPVLGIVDGFARAFFSPANICLGAGMALIPVIGNMLEDSGHLGAVVRNARMSKAAFSTVAPSLVGLLPVPGGALISAPLIDKTGGDAVTPAAKCALNVWFRHVLYLVYPVNAVILVSTTIAGVNVYVSILYLLPFFAASMLAGYWFFLRDLKGRLQPVDSSSKRKAIEALVVLGVTPAVDIALRTTFPAVGIHVENLSLVIATSASLVLAWYWGRYSPRGARKVILKAKPWHFYLFIVFMFFYLNVFLASGITSLIARYSLDKFTLLVVIGFALGFITGRVQVPETIVIPIYLTTFSIASMSPLAFAIGYFCVHLGYLNSPVHPCLSVTLVYFKTTFVDTLKRMLPPTLVCLAVAVAFTFLA